MKKILLLIALLALTGCGSKTCTDITCGGTPHYDSWTKYKNNPVLSPENTWDEGANFEPTVLYEDGLWRMYYSGATWDCSIGLATSTDGINWNKYSGNPVVGQGHGGKAGTACRNTIYKENGIYYAFSDDLTGNGGGGDMYISSSTDGKTFTTRATPIVVPTPGGYDQGGLANSFVLKKDGIYYLLYEASTNGWGGYEQWAINLATSSDMRTWNKYSGNPLSSIRTAGGMFGGPWVIEKNGTYFLTTHQSPAGNVLPTPLYLHSSTDLKKWTVLNDGNPILTKTDNWESDQIADASIVEVNGKTYLYYDGDDNYHGDFKAKIGMASYDGTYARMMGVDEDLVDEVPSVDNQNENQILMGGSPSFGNNGGGTWSYYKKITADKTKVGSGGSKFFPNLFLLSNISAGSNFWTTIKSDCSDLRIASSSSDAATEIPIEVVSCDTTNKTGEIYFKGSQSDSSDTEFYLIYGNSSATAYASSDAKGSQAVWDSNYVAVYHLQSDGSDSTSNGRTLTAGGTVTYVDAKAGKGASFGTTNTHTNYLRRNTGDELSSGVFSFSLFFKNNYSRANGDGGIIHDYRRDNSTYSAYITSYFDQPSSGNIGLYSYNPATWSSQTQPTDQNWHFYGGSSNGSSFKQNLDNSWASAQTFTPGGITSNSRDTLGNSYPCNGGAAITADEYRLSKTQRADAWFTTEYNNVSSNSTFWKTIGGDTSYNPAVSSFVPPPLIIN